MEDYADVIATTGNLLDRITIQKAATLARAGSYSSADALLADLTKHSPDLADAWDLRAKIMAQQGRLEEGRDCWNKALQIDPKNASALAGIARIDRLRRYPIWVTWVAPATMASVTILAVAVIGLSFANRLGEDRESILKQMSAASRSEDEAVQRLSKHLEDLDQKTKVVIRAQDLATKSLRGISRIEAGVAADGVASRDLGLRLDKTSAELAKLVQDYRKDHARTSKTKPQ